MMQRDNFQKNSSLLFFVLKFEPKLIFFIQRTKHSQDSATTNLMVMLVLQWAELVVAQVAKIQVIVANVMSFNPTLY